MDTAAVLRDISLVGQSYAVIVTAVAPLGALAIFFIVAYVLPRL